MKFSELKVNEKIIQATMDMEFVDMTEIQEQAIPAAVEGRDILGQAQTGTGKTAAFVIPVLERIDFTQKHLQCLMLAPTRELGQQIGEQLAIFSKYFEIIFDHNEFTELFANIKSKDFLQFVDLKPYSKRLEETYAKTDIHDSITVAHGKVEGNDLVLACMDFEFIGGSLGSVMGEKISRACDYCMLHKIPFMIINKSGGARMMESAFSLMQLAKTSGKLSQLADAKIPYISLCTDPTFGGTTASFAMLGDIICGEPGALIGFAGPRVIKETIKKDLPEGFQRSEFLLEHGFLDFSVSRNDLNQKLTTLLSIIWNQKKH